MNELDQEDVYRFFSHIKEEDGCWLWTKGKFSHYPHGKFKAKGKTLKAHRVSYFFHYGYVPELLRHTCSNPHCCNPNHLIEGTQQDNMNDMVKQGNSTYGEINPNAKLTNSQVLEIRDSSLSFRELASIYDVTPTSISYIKHRRSWKHI